ncbi:MAG: hypothetical protein ABEJ35_03385 [Halobacteriaceae archaeon]
MTTTPFATRFDVSGSRSQITHRRDDRQGAILMAALLIVAGLTLSSLTAALLAVVVLPVTLAAVAG